MWNQELYFVSGFGSSGETSEKYTAFQHLLCPKPPGASPPVFIESSFLLEPPNMIRKTFQRVLRCFQIKHTQSVMMFVQVKVGLVLRVGVRIQ